MVRLVTCSLKSLRRRGNRTALFAVLIGIVAATCATAWHGASAAGPQDARCDASLVAAARGSFRTAYAAGDFDAASSALRSIWADCALPHQHALAPETAGAIANDLALALHRGCDDHECLEVLVEYLPANRSPTPQFARLSPGCGKR